MRAPASRYSARNEGVESEMSQISAYYLKVRYPEVDQMGFVYHGNYIPWLELGRTQALRQHGLIYKAMEEDGILVVVTDLQVAYKTPAHYDENILVVTRVGELGRVKFSFEYEVRRVGFPITEGGNVLTADQLDDIRDNSDLIITATTEHACITRAGKIVRLDREAHDILRVLHEMQQD